MDTASTPFILANGTTLSLRDDKFIVPVDFRPVPSQVSNSTTIPVIDLFDKHRSIIEKISNACKEYSAFQIINHGVPKELCRRMLKASHDFFNLLCEERSHLFMINNETKPLRISHFHVNNNDDKVTMWCEALCHPWHPSDDFAHMLPSSPPQYRELASEYAKEIGWLVGQLLCWISQGLELNQDCLKTRIGEKPTLLTHANYYPPCPNPSLTFGVWPHSDVNAITILLQDEGVSGLQVVKDGQWLDLDPIPDALVINIGHQIEVLTNGRYKSARRRMVTNKDLERASIAMFYGSNTESLVAPIEELVDEEHPPLYGKHRYAKFMEEFKKMGSVSGVRK